MFAIDHAATALLLKRRYPSVPMAPLLLSVQAMELGWVGLNYLGIERTTTRRVVRSVADVQLADMPYSHSVAVPLAADVLTWWMLEKRGNRALARAVALGVASHLVLDLATHNHDIVLWPGRAKPKLGLGLYGSAPMAAFAVEFAYGLLCWGLYRGDRRLLAVIVLANLANASMFSRKISGPERLLAGHPLRVVSFVFGQIVATLILVGALARNGRHVPSARSRAAGVDGVRGLLRRVARRSTVTAASSAR